MAVGKPSDAAYVALAQIGRPRGVNGEFYIWLLADNHERFCDLKKVYLTRRSKRLATHVESFRILSGKAVIKVKGVDTPEQVKLWTNGHLEIDEAERVSLPERMYFQDDIIGLRVTAEDGKHLGTIERVLEMPANDVYACRTSDGREVLIPVVEDVIKKIDIQGGEIIICPLPGLFD